MSCDEELDLGRLARDSLKFRRHAIELAPGEELDVDAGRWRDALVLLESGEIELECAAGERSRFSAGAVLCLRPAIRFLRGSGPEPARLIAISRRSDKPQALTG